MQRIGLAVVLALGLGFVPFGAEGQQVGKVYRIGALSDGPDPASAPLADAMRSSDGSRARISSSRSVKRTHGSGSRYLQRNSCD